MKKYRNVSVAGLLTVGVLLGACKDNVPTGYTRSALPPPPPAAEPSPPPDPDLPPMNRPPPPTPVEDEELPPL